MQKNLHRFDSTLWIACEMGQISAKICMITITFEGVFWL